MVNPLELTKKMISMKPFTADNANLVVKEVETIFKNEKTDYELLENKGCLMLAAWAGKGDRTLILNGHLDVVPANEYQYEPYIQDEMLFGRGCYDMLGACSAMISIMCELSKTPPDIKVILILSTTEETNGEICTKYILDKGYTGDFAICGEPTNLKISVMSKGVFRVKINVVGQSAHSSRPWLGKNAILNAIKIFHEIERLPFASRKNIYFDGASINLSNMKGGHIINQVPDSAEMILDIRFVPGDSPENIIEQIKTVEGNFTVEEISRGCAVMVDENNEYLNILKEEAKKYSGVKNILTAQHGAADTVFFQEKGIPSVEFGLEGDGHHGSNEYIYVESLCKYKNILMGLISEMGKMEKMEKTADSVLSIC